MNGCNLKLPGMPNAFNCNGDQLRQTIKSELLELRRQVDVLTKKKHIELENDVLNAYGIGRNAKVEIEGCIYVITGVEFYIDCFWFVGYGVRKSDHKRKKIGGGHIPFIHNNTFTVLDFGER